MKKRTGEILIGVFLLIMLVILFVKVDSASHSVSDTLQDFVPWLLVSIGVYMGIIHLMQGKKIDRK